MQGIYTILFSFFNYLGQKQDQWLCYHLQYILDLYKKPLIALAQKQTINQNTENTNVYTQYS